MLFIVAVVRIEQVCKFANLVLRVDQVYFGIVKWELEFPPKALMVLSIRFSHGAEGVKGCV